MTDIDEVDPLNSMKAVHGSDNVDGSYVRRVSRVVELLDGKWKAQILSAMKFQTVRLSELKRSIPAASKKALTARLRFLEAAGVIVRKDLSKTVLHVEYELSHTMREPLVALLAHLSEWSKLYDATGQSAMQLSATEAE